MRPDIRIKRVYEPPDENDGIRVLVDRLWPRGISKADAALDHWMKEIAPSTELRKWFGHDSERWPAFRDHYREELLHRKSELDQLAAFARQQTVTLLYAARDSEHNQAVVLREWLEERFARG